MNESERPLENGRRFYVILDNGDGTADVYLRPDALPTAPRDGKTFDNMGTILVRGVERTEGLESDIRERFYDWCAGGETVYL